MTETEQKEFWRKHKKAKAALRRMQSKPAEMERIKQRMAEDMKALKNARIIKEE